MRITFALVLVAGCGSEPLTEPPPPPDMTVSLSFDFAGPPEPDLAEPPDLVTVDLTPVQRTLGFAPVARYGAGFVPALAVGDFNGDKHLDVLAYVGQGCGVDLYLGSAGGKLQWK